MFVYQEREKINKVDILYIQKPARCSSNKSSNGTLRSEKGQSVSKLNATVEWISVLSYIASSESADSVISKFTSS